MRHLFVPALLIALSVPLILGKVPRNGIYGFRTPYTLSSDQVWYRANKIAGIALAVAGSLWLVFASLLPLIVTPRTEALRLVQWYGIASVAGAVVISFWMVYRGRP